MHPVLVEFMDNGMVNGGTTITLYRPDGTVVASHVGRGLVNQHAIGAYIVLANDGSQEWAVDTSGSIKSVSAAAARLLAPGSSPGYPLILDTSTAIIGCDQGANGDCTAEEIDLATGAVRPLLHASTTMPDAMSLGPSLTVLDASYDGETVWLREVSRGSGAGPSVDIAAVDLRSGKVTNVTLPVALVNEQNLTISRDGKWVAGQEDAGVDVNNVVQQHLHLISLATGKDADIQGSAPYVAGLRPPSIQFAPDAGSVMWWGALSSGPGIRVNVAAITGVGKTISVDGNDVASGNLSAVFWLDGTRLVVQSLPPGATVAIDKDTGEMALVNRGVWPTSVEAVMYASPAAATS